MKPGWRKVRGIAQWNLFKARQAGEVVCMGSATIGEDGRARLAVVRLSRDDLQAFADRVLPEMLNAMGGGD